MINYVFEDGTAEINIQGTYDQKGVRGIIQALMNLLFTMNEKERSYKKNGTQTTDRSTNLVIDRKETDL
jgi:hypothetical protein